MLVQVPLQDMLQDRDEVIKGRDDVIKKSDDVIKGLNEVIGLLRAKEEGHLTQLAKLTVIYELRETLTWFARTIYSNETHKAAGALYNTFFSQHVATEDFKLSPLGAEVVSQVAPHLQQGMWQKSDVQKANGMFGDTHVNMHGGAYSPPGNIEIDGLKGIAVGGSNRAQIFRHAVIFACFQRVCMAENIEIPPALRRILVLNEACTAALGTIENGLFLPTSVSEPAQPDAGAD